MGKKWLKVLIVAVVVLAGVSAFLALTLTRSRLGRRPRPAMAPLVKVVEVQPTTVPIVIRSMGGVQAARMVRLVPQVSGRVVHVSRHLIPGSRVKRDEVLVKIDSTDYELAVRDARAAVADAQLALDVQLGHRAVAKKELQLVKGAAAPTPEGMRLASRESHVENARVQLDAAKSRLEQALLARQRTVLRAPFQARVSEKAVDVGQVVTTQSVLATLVASDEVWVEATLPVEQLRWIDVPGASGRKGAPVVVRQKLAGAFETVRRGEVLGLLPGLQDQGKLARLMVRVRDPFGTANAKTSSPEGAGADAGAGLPLLVGSYVHLEIQGHTVSGVFPLPRGALRENGKVWICDEKKTLAFRSVEVVWGSGETVYVRGQLEAGDKVVSSRLTAPLPGMKVSLADEGRPTPRRQSAGGAVQPGPRRTSAR